MAARELGQGIGAADSLQNRDVSTKLAMAWSKARQLKQNSAIESGRTQLGSRPDIGRWYSIDLLDAAAAAMDQEATDAERYLSFPDWDPFVDYLCTGWKNEGKSLKYDAIKYIGKPLAAKSTFKGDEMITQTSGYYGLVYARIGPSPQNLYDGNGDIVIPAKTPAIQIDIPPVDFPDTDPSPVVTIEMMSRSFASLAEAIHEGADSPDVIFGLTHPRLASLSRRWGFTMIEKPFSPDIYTFVQEAAQSGVPKPNDLEHLQRAAQQVLICQSVDGFLAREGVR